MDTLSLQAKFLELRSKKSFELFVVFIIIFSAMMVGAKTYNLPSWSMQMIIWLDVAITLIFLVEIGIRFLSAFAFLNMVIGIYAPAIKTLLNEFRQPGFYCGINRPICQGHHKKLFFDAIAFAQKLNLILFTYLFCLG